MEGSAFWFSAPVRFLWEDVFGGAGADIFRGFGPLMNKPLDGQNTLGEIFNSSIKTLRATIKKGKKSSNSWAQPDLVAQLDTWDTRVGAAAMETKQAEWAINTIVRFNEWENQTPAEFALVASSWRALMREFACSKCEGLLKITRDEDSLRCACQNVSVNLLDRN